MKAPLSISWFSAGVSSAVATWLERNNVDRIIYQHIDDQESDTMRFVKDCERWFGKPVEIIQSPLKSVEAACRCRGYVNGVRGASCTRMLKRDLRKEWERGAIFFNNFRYIWGMDASESDRAERRREEMPEHEHSFPLIERGIDKKEAHGILEKAGIRRPRMYDLGYPNNNCVGCVKGGMGYWNKIRIDFPEVFKARAAMERVIGGTCIKGHFLDELDPEAGRAGRIILPECGAACELVSNNDEGSESGS